MLNEIRKLIDKQAKIVYVEMHAINKGKDAHHVYGRISFFCCCRHFIKSLTKVDHGNWKILKDLRIFYRADKLRAEKNWEKRAGCLFPIFAECEDCLLLVPTNPQVNNQKELS